MWLGDLPWYGRKEVWFEPLMGQEGCRWGEEGWVAHPVGNDRWCFKLGVGGEWLRVDLGGACV